MRIENDSGFEWRSKSQVCKSPSLVSISQKETETCIALSPGLRPESDQRGPTPGSCYIISDTNTKRADYKMLFALLVMFSGSSCQSVGAHGPGRRNESRNNQYFTIFTHPGCYLSPSLHKIHSHNKYEINATKSYNIMCVRQQVSQRFDV